MDYTLVLRMWRLSGDEGEVPEGILPLRGEHHAEEGFVAYRRSHDLIESGVQC
jgi:hypothetical protein